MIRCRKCNRILKNPAAIEKGIGPVCEKKVGLSRSVKQQEGDTDVIVPYDGGDFFIERLPCATLNGHTGETEMLKHSASGIKTNVQRRIYKHSPTGYNFGYGGSGPADFALNICLALVHADDAYQHYQDFKFKFVAIGKAESDSLLIVREAAEQWFRDRGVKLLSE